LLLDRTHRPWAIATTGLFLASWGAYALYARLAVNGPRGGSWPGLAFGIAGTGLMVFAMLLVARKKARARRWGRAETWLRAHIWLGLLAYPLILFHAGMQLGGPLTTALMVIFTLVVATGAWGLGIQNFLPRVMTGEVSFETIYEQIDDILVKLAAEADEAVVAVAGPLAPEAPEPALVGAEAKAEGAAPAGADAKGAAAAKPKAARRGKAAQPLEGGADLKEFYLRVAQPYLTGKARPAAFDKTTERSALFEQVRVSLPAPLHKSVTQLEEICEERRQLLTQKRLHHWLHGWLYLHVPLSWALVALTAVHAVQSLKY